MFTVKRFFISVFLFFVISCLCAVCFSEQADRFITCEGYAMEPTVSDGETLAVQYYKSGELPARGDVVICHFPGRTSQVMGLFTADIDFIKRVVAVPGDTVIRIAGVTYVNSAALDPSKKKNNSYTYKKADDGTITYYLNDRKINLTDQETYRCEFDYTYTLKDNEYFVAGDNRYNSHDSRDWNGPDLPFCTANDITGDVGPITLDMIVGRVCAVVTPVENARAIETDANYVDMRDQKYE